MTVSLIDISSRSLKLHQKQTTAQALSLPLVKFSCLWERPQTFLKTHSISDFVNAIYSKGLELY